MLISWSTFLNCLLQETGNSTLHFLKNWLLGQMHNLYCINTGRTFEEVEKDAHNWQAVSDWMSRHEHPARIPKKWNFWDRWSGVASNPFVAPNFDYLKISSSLIRSISSK